MIEESPLLKVLEAKPADVGLGVAAIDHAIFEKMELKKGDIIVIKGRKKTVAIVQPGYYEDVGMNTIRIDGSIRRNADVAIDDKVKIVKIEAQNAKVVSFSPLQPLKIKGGEEYLAQILAGRPVTTSDIIEINVMGRKIDLVVTSFSPSGEGVVIEIDSKIKIGEAAKPIVKPSHEDIRIPRVIYEDIGGLGETIKKVREMIELPLRHPELFDRLGVEAPKGVLLHGPPGTGKTLLAKAVASETQANFITISGPEIMSKFYGESEERLRKIFGLAEKNAPSIVFIDEIDSIAPKRDEVTGETERRVVAQLLAIMDGLEARGKVVVIGATNRPNALDPALRRPGRFDREIAISMPDRTGRYEILQIHTRGMPVSKDVELNALADLTHGYTGADLSALTKEAAMRALRRILPEIDLDMTSIPAEILNKIVVTKQDFLDAFRELEPSALREVYIEKPNVHWQDIGGLLEAKQEIIESIEWPLKYPELFKHIKAKPPKGILLYGPPGTGKTLLAKAVATETEANFISVKGPELNSKWFGESEKAIRETFRKAKQAAPCIIFFDEIDAIVPIRGMDTSSQATERVVSQILTELDGIEELHNIIVIAATNRPDIIDPALLRPGRFDRLIYISQPDLSARTEIFRIHTKDKPLESEIDIKLLANRTEGYTGADISAVCNEAAMLAIREFVLGKKELNKESVANYKILSRHFEEALHKVKATSREDLAKYETFAKKIGNRL